MNPRPTSESGQHLANVILDIVRSSWINEKDFCNQRHQSDSQVWLRLPLDFRACPEFTIYSFVAEYKCIQLGPDATSSPDTSGRRRVFYTWRDIAQPARVAIVGDEGDVLEIDHTSPTVLIRAVYDSAGKTAKVLDSYGKTMYPASFNKVWKMKHKVTTNQ